MQRFFRYFGLPMLLLLCLGGCAQPGKSIGRAAQQSGQKAAEVQPESEAAAKNAAMSEAEAEVSLQRAAIALQSGDYLTAKAAYEPAFSAGIEFPAEDYYHYGYVLNRTGDFSAAIKQFEIYTQKVNSGQGYYAEAMQEWSFAVSEQGRLVAKAKLAAEEQARAQAIKAAQQLLKPVAEPEVLALQQALQKSSAMIIEPLSGMELLLVKGGCYPRGDNSGTAGEQQLHEVCVDAFYLGKYEVTQGQWQ